MPPTTELKEIEIKFGIHKKKDFFMNEIKKHFPPATIELMDDKILNDYLTIAAYLSTPEIIMEQLIKLDARFRETLQAKGMMKDNNIIKKEGKHYTGNHKVFAEIINNWAKVNGFNQGGLIHCLVEDESGKTTRKIIQLPEQIPTVSGILDPEIFRGLLLANGYLSKDTGVGPTTHGEFSHIWQLYSVVEANKEYNFLHYDFIDLYKKIAKPPYIAYSLPSKLEGKNDVDVIEDGRVDEPLEVSMWEILFDNVWQPELLNHPGTLQDLIRDEKNKIPTLSEIVNGRISKRMNYSYIVNNSSQTELTFNSSIVFKTNDKPSQNVIFDDISNDCFISVDSVSDEFKFSKPSAQASILDQALEVFDPTKMPFPPIVEIYNFLKEKKEASEPINHRDLVLHLAKIRFNIDPHEKHVIFLIENFQQFLLAADRNEIDEHQTMVKPLFNR